MVSSPSPEQRSECDRSSGKGRGSRSVRVATVGAVLVGFLTLLYPLLLADFSRKMAELMPQGREKGGPANHNRNDGIFVDYRTEQGIRTWACTGYVDKRITFDRVPLRPEMHPHFNFTTSIRTNLKILVMGDSVGLQLSEFLQLLLLQRRPMGSNSGFVLSTASGMGRDAPAIHVAAPLVPDGNDNSMTGRGAIAGWRIVGMFLPDALNWAPPNWNRGWKLEDVEALRGYVSNATSPNSTTAWNDNESWEKNRISPSAWKDRGSRFRRWHQVISTFSFFVYRAHPGSRWRKLQKRHCVGPSSWRINCSVSGSSCSNQCTTVTTFCRSRCEKKWTVATAWCSSLLKIGRRHIAATANEGSTLFMFWIKAG